MNEKDTDLSSPFIMYFLISTEGQTRHRLMCAKGFCVFALWAVCLCSWNAGVSWMRWCYFLGVALTVVVPCSLLWGTTFFYRDVLFKLISLHNTIWSLFLIP